MPIEIVKVDKRVGTAAASTSRSWVVVTCGGSGDRKDLARLGGRAAGG